MALEEGELLEDLEDLEEKAHSMLVVPLVWLGSGVMAEHEHCLGSNS